MRLPYNFIVFLFFYSFSDPHLESRRRAFIRLAVGFPLGVASVRDLFHCAARLNRQIFQFLCDRSCVGARF